MSKLVLDYSLFHFVSPAIIIPLRLLKCPVALFFIISPRNFICLFLIINISFLVTYILLKTSTLFTYCVHVLFQVLSLKAHFCRFKFLFICKQIHLHSVQYGTLVITSHTLLSSLRFCEFTVYRFRVGFKRISKIGFQFALKINYSERKY